MLIRVNSIFYVLRWIDGYGISFRFFDSFFWICLVKFLFTFWWFLNLAVNSRCQKLWSTTKISRYTTKHNTFQLQPQQIWCQLQSVSSKHIKEGQLQTFCVELQRGQPYKFRSLLQSFLKNHQKLGRAISVSTTKFFRTIWSQANQQHLGFNYIQSFSILGQPL